MLYYSTLSVESNKSNHFFGNNISATVMNHNLTHKQRNTLHNHTFIHNFVTPF